MPHYYHTNKVLDTPSTCRNHGTSECSNNMSFPNFLKTYNPPLYKQYHLEREVAGTTGKGHNIGSYFGGDK